VSGSYRDVWRALLPADVAVAEGGPSQDVELLGGERELAAPFGPVRRAEFAAGRRCARVAMEELGLGAEPILARGRQPQWPEAVVGSISHSRGYCVAAVGHASAYRAVGIDVERRRPIEPAVAQRIAVPDELAAVPTAAAALVVFSAKESFYKLQHPVTGVFLGFRDVRVTLDAEGRLAVELLRAAGPLTVGERFEGRYHLGDEHVMTAFAWPWARSS